MLRSIVILVLESIAVLMLESIAVFMLGSIVVLITIACRQVHLCNLSIRCYKHITCTQVALLILAAFICAAIVFAFAACSVASCFAILGSSLFERSPGCADGSFMIQKQCLLVSCRLHLWLQLQALSTEYRVKTVMAVTVKSSKGELGAALKARAPQTSGRAHLVC